MSRMESITPALTAPVGVFHGEPQRRGEELPVLHWAGTESPKGPLITGRPDVPALPSKGTHSTWHHRSWQENLLPVRLTDLGQNVGVLSSAEARSTSGKGLQVRLGQELLGEHSGNSKGSQRGPGAEPQETQCIP